MVVYLFTEIFTWRHRFLKKQQRALQIYKIRHYTELKYVQDLEVRDGYVFKLLITNIK